MKIFFLQPREFASRIASNRLVAALSAEKFRLGRSILFFLSLLLGLSACAGTTIEGPSRLPREVQPGSPVSTAVVNQFPSHVSGGGSLRVFSVYSEGGYSYNVNQNLQLGLAANYEYDNFQFTGLNFYAPRPWTYINSFGGSFSALYSLNDKWSVMLVPILQVAGEHGADLSRSLIYGGAGAAVYSFGQDRTIGLGVGALNNLEQASVFPFIMVNWKFNEWLRLSTPYRAGPSGPGGVELTYFPIKGNKDLRIGLGATYLSKRFRLSENSRNSLSNGIGEYDTIPVFARVSYRILPVVDVNLYGGASLYNYILVDDPHGGRLFHSHQNVAPFIGIGLSLNFEKYMGGGG
jgi:Domain of unknown function (DUF6268)